MKKITFLLTLLLSLFLSMGTWAQVEVVTIADHDVLQTTYGTIASGNKSFTSNAASGVAGVVVSSDDITFSTTALNFATTYGYRSCFGMTTPDKDTDYTVTITAPTGYKIIGYTFYMKANSKSYVHTVTPASGGAANSTTNPSSSTFIGNELSAGGLNDAETSFTIRTATGGNAVYLTYFYVYLQKDMSDYTTDFNLNGERNNQGNYKCIGLHTPGSTANVYGLTAFALQLLNGDNSAPNGRYLLISKKSDATSTLSKNEVVGVSVNKPEGNSGSTYLTYFFFDEMVELTGGTTYYIYFSSTDPSTDPDSYTLTNERFRVTTATYEYGIKGDDWDTTVAPIYSSKLKVLSSRTLEGSDGTATAKFYSFGFALPSRTAADVAYSLSSIKVGFPDSNDGNQSYAAICKTPAKRDDAKVNDKFVTYATDVIAISSNNPYTQNTTGTYNFASPVYLKGGETYYLHFFKSKTPSNGYYERDFQRVAVKTGTTYDPGMYGDSEGKETVTDWAPIFQ